MKLYSILVIAYIIFTIVFTGLNNSGERQNVFFYATSRLVVVSISFVLYYYLIKSLHLAYFRYLFIAGTIFLLFGLLALWDSTINRDNSLFKGFQFICIGYILENLCFSAGFVYRIIKADRENKHAEILHEKQLAQVQFESQKETMQHIGREIHDNVGQKLTLASLYTQQFIYESKVPQVNAKIENISSIINHSLSELRQLSKSLTDDTINDSSINELLQQECNKVNSIKKLDIVFNSNQKNILLPYQIKNILLRIMQEFLQNSIKHAQCSKVQVTLVIEEKKLQLQLADNGQGFDISAVDGKGIGINNMKKRTELIGGHYLLESKPENGTTLNITIPL